MQPIETVPHNRRVLLIFDVNEKTDVKVVVVGDVDTFKGQVHYFWSGAYDNSMRMLLKHGTINETPVGWEELPY